MGSILIFCAKCDFLSVNVVEEMAIASGTPVYLLNEPGINAFAAGLTTRDAAIGVTRGAIENLTIHPQLHIQK